jgi:hypothetical protein
VMGGTDIEKRLYKLELSFTSLAQQLASVAALAGKALQDAGASSGGGGGGSGVTISLVYTTGAISPRVGNVYGGGSFQIVFNIMGTSTATGAAGDSGLNGVNVTGGSTTGSAYGIVAQLQDGKWYYLVLDCSASGTVAPASTTATASIAGSSAMTAYPTGSSMSVGNASGSSSVVGVPGGTGTGITPTPAPPPPGP